VLWAGLEKVIPDIRQRAEVRVQHFGSIASCKTREVSGYVQHDMAVEAPQLAKQCLPATSTQHRIDNHGSQAIKAPRHSTST
jgi:hypothetical protein